LSSLAREQSLAPHRVPVIAEEPGDFGQRRHADIACKTADSARFAIEAYWIGPGSSQTVDGGQHGTLQIAFASIQRLMRGTRNLGVV